MPVINRSNKTLGLLLILLAALLGSDSSCKRSPLDTRTPKLLTGVSQPVRVSASDGEAGEPAVAASPDGSVYVVWVNHTLKSQADVMIARFTGDGRMQGSAVRVNPKPGVATAWRGDPPTVAVAPDQTVFVGWTERVESEAGHATDLYLSSSSDHGQTFNPPVKVNDDKNPAVHGMHSLAIGNDGHIFLAWLDERNISPKPMKDMKMASKTSGRHMESNREIFFSSSSDGGRSFAPNQRLASEVCPCCKTSLVVASDGHLYLSWRQVLPGDYRHIAVSSSTDGGIKFTKPVIVSDDQWTIKGCPVSGAALSVAANGALRVLWYSAGEKGDHGLYWSESRDGGQSFIPRQLVAASNAHGTPVFVNDLNDQIGVWEAGQDGKPELFMTQLGSKLPAGAGAIIATDGGLPSAAATTDQVFVVYLAKDGQKENVWLVAARKENLAAQLAATGD